MVQKALIQYGIDKAIRKSNQQKAKYTPADKKLRNNIINKERIIKLIFFSFNIFVI